jgi:translation initiation factor IF-1
MAGREEISLTGRVVAAISGAACRVELKNGHRRVAHTTRKNSLDLTRLNPGDELILAASPFDFSKARIVRKKTERKSDYEGSRIGQETL